MSMLSNWPRLIFLFGVIALLAGVIDPLEGSIAIAAGSGLITLSVYMTHDKHRENFLFSFILIIFGVFFLFFFSSLGGFGDGAVLSWWWALLILPYPLGWLLAIVLVVAQILRKPARQRT
jgi:hypothetical protein